MKDTVLDTPILREAWSTLRRTQLRRAYESRRDEYARIALERGLVYREAEIADAVRTRLAKRGYKPIERALGEIHTFAFVPRIFWHDALLPDLREIGPVTWFDHTVAGRSWSDLYRHDRDHQRARKAISDQIFPALVDAHRKRPVDWVFIYASGWEIETETVRRITEEIGVPVVGMCLDDKHCWTGPASGGQRGGQIDLAPLLDIAWTSARVACEWYLVEGGRPLYMPEGFDHTLYHPRPTAHDIPVSFVGGAYGFRPAAIRWLSQKGVRVQTFGQGWPAGSIPGDAVAGVFTRSLINLGMGGIGYSEELTNVKGRDLEVPGSGGGVYLTTFNSDLAQHFEIGREILCYRGRDEMLELIRYYLAHEEEAESIAHNGYRRSMAEHRWLHRYIRLCTILGILPQQPRGESGAR